MKKEEYDVIIIGAGIGAEVHCGRIDYRVDICGVTAEGVGSKNHLIIGITQSGSTAPPDFYFSILYLTGNIKPAILVKIH